MKLFNIQSSFHTDWYVVQEGLKFVHEHSSRQITNALKYVLFRNMDIDYVFWDPIYVTVVTESVCTQRCLYCLWHSPHTKRPYWPLRLTLQQYRKIMNVLKKTAISHVHLCGTGDPMLNKEIFKIINHTIKSGKTCSLMTNMNRHVTPHLERIALSGINRLNTNLDSGDPKQFEEIRYGAKWDTVVSNIRKLSALRKKHGKKFKIGVYCITMKSNVHTYKDLMEICRDIGADDIIFSYLIPIDFVKHPICSKENIIQESDRKLAKMIDEAVDYGRSLGLRVFPPRFPPKKLKRVNCSTMWWKLMINLPNDKIPKDLWVGNASSHCDLTHQGDGYSYGNILTQPFSEVWNGPTIRGLRRKLMEDAPEICRECPGL